MDSLASSATRVPGFRKRVMVDSDRLEAIVSELRVSIPADMQEAREILTQKDSVINQAHLEARRVKESAEHEAQALKTSAREEQATRIDETEIVREAHAKAEGITQLAAQEAQEVTQEAQRRAFQIVEAAEAAGTTRRDGADQYARETLFDLEERLSIQLGQVRRGIDSLGLDVDSRVPS
jgi:cell division septum initiation protein DivIVA